ncbi:unnamed protein product [Candida verbasci]|uniref:TUG ubiquitin-like domain-containing protein n=1 Tax=Candida verbasci TaxID=1227364 RepID=A0A9W4TYQ9_9ASCO|nr:unnamed protein product [Candida verbasci]
MSTIPLNINYQSVTKKISINKTDPISKVIVKSLEIFKINSSLYSGSLLHNNKILDDSLPIRFTDLVNNSKLIFKIKKLDMNKEVNVKFIIENNSPKIEKINISKNLLELIEKFNVDKSRSSQLRIFNLTINSSDYEHTQLSSIIGDVGNVVIRLNYLKSDNEIMKLKKEQEDINKLQIEQNRIRMEEEKKRNEERREKELLEGREKELVERKREIEQKEKEQDIEMKDEDDATIKSDKTVDMKDEGNQPTENEEGMKLFIPSNKDPHTHTYENPDNDYEMNVDTLKIYQNSIRSSGKRLKKNKDTTRNISKYNIRIKFPDGSILQLNFTENVKDIKFGQLIKKIDELLYPQFLNHYSLKFGHPPFKKIDLSFKNNTEYLYKIPDFQNERIVLIWELNKKDLNGPFIKQDFENLIIKDSSQLPEIVLEQNRGNEESKAIEHKKTEVDENKTKSKSKVPKWFKMK